VSLAKDAPTPFVRALVMFLWVTLIPGAGLSLFIFGPPIIKWIALTVGLESPPPARPPSLPQAAQPLPIYGNTSQPIAWKWVVCVERDTPRYTCRVYDVHGRLEIVGDYWARAGTWGYNQPHRGRLPHPGESLEYSFFVPERRAVIHLIWPRGATLIARGDLLFPASGTKATVLGEKGDLSDETPMSAEERKYVSR
jgi:hypothetical protein